MQHLKFEWDTVKSASNLGKHGVSFEEAKTVFTDEFGRLLSDPEHSGIAEDHSLLLGSSLQSKLLVVCHCVREAESVRIISARKANKNERQIYERFRYA